MANDNSHNAKQAEQLDTPIYREGSKKAQLVDRLQDPDGVTIAKLAAAFGWQPHTTRAALTGLRKDGHAVEKLPPKEGKSAARYRLAT
ncbi:conserved hypothetical protein [Oceanicaulis sp. 350]|nr:conserved hypothetical protein [Oceanicaulis sp. 350]